MICNGLQWLQFLHNGVAGGGGTGETPPRNSANLQIMGNSPRLSKQWASKAGKNSNFLYFLKILLIFSKTFKICLKTFKILIKFSKVLQIFTNFSQSLTLSTSQYIYKWKAAPSFHELWKNLLNFLKFFEICSKKFFIIFKIFLKIFESFKKFKL